jgi:hypothetical protein
MRRVLVSPREVAKLRDRLRPSLEAASLEVVVLPPGEANAPTTAPAARPFHSEAPLVKVASPPRAAKTGTAMPNASAMRRWWIAGAIGKNIVALPAE